MQRFTFVAESEAATERLGRALADELPDGMTVALVGTLGAGKTRLVRAVAAGLGIPEEEVVSPTFVLCQEYRGRRRMFHLDAYRLRDEDEFAELGVDELFESEALVFVEWADRVAHALPEQYLEIEVEAVGETARCFHIQPHGGLDPELIQRVERHFLTT